MNENSRKHIDTLTVVYGHAFPVEALDTIVLGRPSPYRVDEPSPWLSYPAGRGA